MTSISLAVAVAAITFIACPVQGAPALAACSMLSEADGAKLLGASLGEVVRRENPPEVTNGNDRQSSCGYFPKGYHIETAEDPPDFS